MQWMMNFGEARCPTVLLNVILFSEVWLGLSLKSFRQKKKNVDYTFHKCSKSFCLMLLQLVFLHDYHRQYFVEWDTFEVILYIYV